MSKRIFVKPTGDRQVRDPKSMEYLPADGAEVSLDSPHGTYWLRRLQCGEVEEVKKSGKGFGLSPEEGAAALNKVRDSALELAPTVKRHAGVLAIEAELEKLGFPVDEPTPEMTADEVKEARAEFDAAKKSDS